MTEVDDAKLQMLAQHTLSPDSTMWNMGPHVTADVVVDAMVRADAMGAGEAVAAGARSA